MLIFKEKKIHLSHKHEIIISWILDLSFHKIWIYRIVTTTKYVFRERMLLPQKCGHFKLNCHQNNVLIYSFMAAWHNTENMPNVNMAIRREPYGASLQFLPYIIIIIYKPDWVSFVEWLLLGVNIDSKINNQLRIVHRVWAPLSTERKWPRI